MSIPSSSEEVATRQGSLPDLSSSSTISRSSWASEPWWARAISSNGITPATSSPSAAGVRRRGSVVLGCRELFVGDLVVELVQALGEPLGAAAVVDEDDRRGVLADQLQQLGVDRRPDRARVGGRVQRGLDRPRVDSVRACVGMFVLTADPAAPGGEAEEAGGTSGFCMSSTGTTICRSRSLRIPALTISHSRFGPTRNLRDPLQRALGRREADPLRFRVALGGDHVREPLEGQRQVGAALGLGDGVDLVDDHGLDPGEDLAHLRGDHQVERLRGGDQDVGRRALHRLALLLRRVAGPQADRDLGADSLQRRAQVALDVVGERLQRRDVDDLRPGAELLGPAGERVDPPEEGAQGLAGAGRGADQGVGAATRSSASRPPAPASAPRTRPRTSASCAR